MDLLAFWKRAQDYVYKDEDSYLYRCACDEVILTAPELPPELHGIVCESDTLAEAHEAIDDFPLLIAQRVARGDLAFLAVHRRQWVYRHSTVLGPTTYPITGYSLPLAADEAYLENAETIPEWRGRNICPACLGATAQMFLARGITTLYLMVAVNNTSSCRAVEKVGLQRVGIIKGRRRLGRWRADFQVLAAEPQP